MSSTSTSTVLSKETVASLNIDVARSKFPHHRSELGRLFGFLMMRAPVEASVALSRPASRVQLRREPYAGQGGAASGAHLQFPPATHTSDSLHHLHQQHHDNKSASITGGMSISGLGIGQGPSSSSSSLASLHTQQLYDTNRYLHPSLPFQSELILNPEFRNRTKVLPAALNYMGDPGGGGGANTMGGISSSSSSSRVIALLSSESPPVRRNVLKQLRRILASMTVGVAYSGEGGGEGGGVGGVGVVGGGSSSLGSGGVAWGGKEGSSDKGSAAYNTLSNVTQIFFEDVTWLLRECNNYNYNHSSNYNNGNHNHGYSSSSSSYSNGGSLTMLVSCLFRCLKSALHTPSKPPQQRDDDDDDGSGGGYSHTHNNNSSSSSSSSSSQQIGGRGGGEGSRTDLQTHSKAPPTHPTLPILLSHFLTHHLPPLSPPLPPRRHD